MPNVSPSANNYPALKPIEELLTPTPTPKPVQPSTLAPQPATQQPAPTQYQPAPPAGTAQETVSIVDADPNAVSQEELEWAVAIEQHASGGGQITEAQLAKHTNIMERLGAQREAVAVNAGVSKEDFAWASQLEQKSAQGYEAQPSEVARYQEIAAKIQTYESAQAAPAPQPATPPTTQPAAPHPQPTAPQTDPTQTPPAVDLGDMNLVKEKADLTPKFESLDQTIDQNYFMKKLESFTASEAVDQRKNQAREIGVGIWLEGDTQDRVKLSQKLIENDYSDVVGRIMTHQETSASDVITVMKDPGFPVVDYMNALEDNEAFLILNTLSSEATKGNKDATAIIEKAITAYDRMWDREAPFEQLRTQMQSSGSFQQLPVNLQASINNLLD